MWQLLVVMLRWKRPTKSTFVVQGVMSHVCSDTARLCKCLVTVVQAGNGATAEVIPVTARSHAQCQY